MTHGENLRLNHVRLAVADLEHVQKRLKEIGGLATRWTSDGRWRRVLTCLA